MGSEGGRVGWGGGSGGGEAGLLGAGGPNHSNKPPYLPPTLDRHASLVGPTNGSLAKYIDSPCNVTVKHTMFHFLSLINLNSPLTKGKHSQTLYREPTEVSQLLISNNNHNHLFQFQSISIISCTSFISWMATVSPQPTWSTWVGVSSK